MNALIGTRRKPRTERQRRGAAVRIGRRAAVRRNADGGAAVVVREIFLEAQLVGSAQPMDERFLDDLWQPPPTRCCSRRPRIVAIAARVVAIAARVVATASARVVAAAGARIRQRGIARAI